MTRNNLGGALTRLANLPASSLTIIDAMDSEQLFADWFRGSSWNARGIFRG